MKFFEVLTTAVNDFIEYGFDSQTRVERWVRLLKEAAIAQMIPEHQMHVMMEKSLGAAFTRLVTKGGLVNKHVSRYNIEKLKPKLRSELDRRIMASASLIKYNREESVSNLLRRFEGWATSIPKGGTDIANRVKEKQKIKKSLGNITFEQRRVIIDQTHKLISNINEIVAMDNGAIAAKWHSHWKQLNYDYRKDHKERDEKIYIVRNSWADKAGYLKPVNGYTDEMTQPGQEVFCRCNYSYIYNLRDAENLLTDKGKIALESAKMYKAA
jgi:hypothetical protein